MPTGVKTKSVVYGSLFAVWVMIVGWQTVEHNRVKEAARSALINRGRDITTTLGLVIRSQRRWWGTVPQDPIESALKELIKPGELTSVALLNKAGDVVISAGAPIDINTRGIAQTERWDARSLTLVNLVDLGAHVAREGETGQPTVVLPSSGPPRGPRRQNNPGSTNTPSGTLSTTNPSPRRPGPGDGERRRGWMDEKEWEAMRAEKGAHYIAIVIPTELFRAANVQDIWLRWVIASFAGVAVLGLGFAWRNLETSAELQMRLLRASEMNSHLRDMNLAAAGLAHETRNPLNIIRGVAHMISKEPDASSSVRQKSREIADEVDRVTAQLNEFINYSKPREVRRAPVSLNAIVSDVARALASDVEDKSIQLSASVNGLSVEADEQMLRQVLFNLLINAIQAADAKGEIRVVAGKLNGSGAYLEVRDNGPGVAPEHRTDIFKPYFTTHQKGTGLGLAIVQQIVLAHGWDIECLPNEPRGAIFRLSRLKLSSRTGSS